MQKEREREPRWTLTDSQILFVSIQVVVFGARSRINWSLFTLQIDLAG